MNGGTVIVVADEIVDPAAMASELSERWAAAVRAEDGLPSGGGIVALLAGPGTDVSGAALDRLPDLRAIVVTSMGWDHVDVEAARARNVTVVGVDPYCVDEVAEHAVALVLDLLRGVTWLDATVRAGNWDYGRVGRPVRGAVLGLVGLGRIGAAVAWRAAGLGMVVSAHDPVLGTASAAATASGTAATEPEVPSGLRLVPTLEDLVASSDVVSVHVPLGAGTRGLIDKNLLAHFREGSYLVNVSRGEVVTEPALGEALRQGRLAGAALDVLTHEPPDRGDPVLAFPRTVLTPHAAWYSPAAIDRLSHSAGRALARALADAGAVR
ncbi:MAG: NAD(P)-dependent oxidoreductase [Actinomycetota bacterium]|nr:NAD(P)-dependent oxidoreductase [Actinomycetota bacterium]